MIRSIKYTVSNNTKDIEPQKRQWAGMQFEDNVTRIIFDVRELELENALYRIDFNSAGAGYQPSENLEAVDGLFSRSIPLIVTQYGGEVQVTAVITVLDSDGNETGICYSYPVTVYFTDVEKDSISAQETEANLSAIEHSVKKMSDAATTAANSAAKSQEAAEDAASRTEEARFFLEEGTVFVFAGGDAQSKRSLQLVVDGSLSDISTNPVQNKVINAALNDVSKKAEAYVNNKIIVSKSEPQDAVEGTIWLMIGEE